MISGPNDNLNREFESGQEMLLYGLLARLSDETISDAEFLQLQHMLDESPAARQLYLKYQAIHAALAMGAGGAMGYSPIDAQLAVERAAMTQISSGKLARSEVLCGASSNKTGRSRSFGRAIGGLAALAATILFVVSTYWLWPRDVAYLPALSADPQPANNHTGPAEQNLPVAEVSFVSETAAWNNPNGSYALGSHVRPGQTLALELGQIELTYETGTKLLLTGPTEFQVRPKGGILRKGEVVARVTVAGYGFTIETPQGKVIDLGTEFGVMVDDFGVSQVSVFEGKVETLAAGAVRGTRKSVELTSGNAIQWTENSIVPVDFHASHYQLQKLNRMSPVGNRPAAAIVDDDYRHGKSLAASTWKTIGSVKEGNGLQLGSIELTDQRPYLLSAREFNPSQGAVSITCDVRFEKGRDTEQPSFAILTRSSNSLSKSGTAWHDMLARAMRCRLGAASSVAEGLLEAGTKLEPDCAPSSLSWGGFSRPQPGKLYHLEMRDDGLNVSFTVALAENPLVRKTITCRSLFRGSENYVAFEGSSRNVVVLERVTVSQESPPSAASSLMAVDGHRNSSLIDEKNAVVSQALNELAPTNAELLLADDFDADTIDLAKWIALGDIVIKDGHAQLGLANGEQHIDTWREHPYLVSRRDFDPRQGPLVILGSIEFSQNFLHGYGGTFSVMTRADRTRGGAQGWTSSILRRGVRHNFWPAAFGFDHSLEIHEKLSVDQITLLTADGFDISPQTRSYLFKVVDDGNSAALTMFDASNLQVQKTLAAATTLAPPTNGSVAFESCWGSPIQLDNVRIYRSRANEPTLKPATRP
jgi:ferric-dicitrate binding protein FerR (iron transport regulator)